MREILFKGKRKNWRELPKEKWWVEGDVIHEPYGVVIQYYVDKRRIKVIIDPETICQFTGISDDKGNRIWENDIVLCEWGATAFGYREYRETIFVDDITDYRTMGILQECEDVKVLGNRFDNPELMECEQNERN